MKRIFDIRFSLDKDMDEFARRKLELAGYKYKENDFHGVYYQAMNAFRRSIQTKPRRVEVAPDVVCPDHLKNGYHKLCTFIIEGQNLNPYLNHSLLRAHTPDTFFNTMGLHHFHLGDGLQKTGKYKHFVKRSGHIAIALVRDDVVYILDICQHGRNGDPNLWFDIRFIEIIHKNWPAEIELFKMKGLLASKNGWNAEDMGQLTKSGISVPYEMEDGTVYMSPGGGITCAKTSLMQTMDTGRDARYIQWAFDILVANIINNLNEYLWPIHIRFVGLDKGVLFVDDTNKDWFFITDPEEEKVTYVRIPYEVIEDESLANSENLLALPSAIKTMNRYLAIQ